MDEDAIRSKWNERYSTSPPEWIGNVENIEEAIASCKSRIEEFTYRLLQEQHLLELLLESGQYVQASQEAGTTSSSLPQRLATQPIVEEGSSRTESHNNWNSLLRTRARQLVNRRHVNLARRVKQKLKTKHWSISGVDSVFDEGKNSKSEFSGYLTPDKLSLEYNHLPLGRSRSRSDSSVSRQILSPSPDGNVPLATQVYFNPLVTESTSLNQIATPNMDIPKDTKRLSNGLHHQAHRRRDNDEYDSDEDEFLSSIKTVVGPGEKIHIGSLDDRATLKRESYLGSTGETTPTESLRETEGDVIKEKDRPMDLELKDVRDVLQYNYDNDYDEDDDDDNDESSSITDLENSGYHNTFTNLAESTLTYILRDTIFASRSNSIGSLGDYRQSVSPEPTTPLGGVSLRPNSGKKRERRTGHVFENEDIMDEEKLQQMLLEIQDSPYHSRSPSSPFSDNTQSDPSSPTHLISYDVCQSLSARSSRMYPVRRNTVVVHGEVLVIRKLVVAGVVTAEKAYLECLHVIKEFYRKPLLLSCTTSQPIISERDINTIFYRIEDLHSLHSSLHTQLETLLSDWGMHSCIGDFFLDLCKNLKLYKDYVEMYKTSLDCLERAKSDPNFKKFLDDVKLTVSNQFKDIPNVNVQMILELLRKPIERLQSYSLVLTDLCQHTPEGHADYSILKQSLNVMSDFIASTHDPRAFKQLSGGFNRELVKQELVVELLEGSRKIRRLFLFHDVLVSAKEKSPRGGEGVKLEPKWYLPLHNLLFHPPGAESIRPVPVTSDQELGLIKSRIADLRSQLNKDGMRDRRSSTLDKDASFKRNFKFMGHSSKPEKLRKKLQEQQVALWMASPSLPLRLFNANGKHYVFLLHNEDERESWISAIKKLQPKAVQSVVLSQFELQDLLSRQKIHLTRDQEEVIEVHSDDENYLTGFLRVHVTSAKDLKTKQKDGLYCGLEFDEYSRYDRKARTLPVNMDLSTLTVIWDQDFEIETVGTCFLKAFIFYKYLLKEEVCATGKLKLPVKNLKASKRCKLDITLHPQGCLTIVVEYFPNIASMGKRPALLSSGVFGFSMDIVAKRENHSIPLIVQTCVDEVERRGLAEVGIYRVAGVLRDVQELRAAFDTDYIIAQQLAYDTDIHAVAGLLKRYFRELPDPLFTDELYMSFVQALALADPEAREQSLVTLLHSLPPVNFNTAVFLFKHLRNVAAEAEYNKMNLNNLATVFGPNLLRPGLNHTAEAAWDVISPVNVLMFFLTCPVEVYEDPSSTGSAANSESRAAKKKSQLFPQSDAGTDVNPSAVTLDISKSPVPPAVIATACSDDTAPSPSVSSPSMRYKQSVI